eukprot:1537395-Ditylum_brightwellii.AAC.1
MTQWESSSMAVMHQWLTANRSFIKHCLGIGLRQKQLHSSDIQDYISMTQSIHTRQGNKSREKTPVGRENKEKKEGVARTQLDIRQMIGWDDGKIWQDEKKVQETLRRLMLEVKEQDRPPDEVRVEEKITDYFTWGERSSDRVG